MLKFAISPTPSEPVPAVFDSSELKCQHCGNAIVSEDEESADRQTTSLSSTLSLAESVVPILEMAVAVEERSFCSSSPGPQRKLNDSVDSTGGFHVSKTAPASPILKPLAGAKDKRLISPLLQRKLAAASDELPPVPPIINRTAAIQNNGQYDVPVSETGSTTTGGSSQTPSISGDERTSAPGSSTGATLEDLPAPMPRSVTLVRDPELGYGFVAGSERPVVVRFVTEGGPSDTLLVPGDQIISINGEDVANSPRERVISLVRNSASQIYMTVCQPHTNKRSSLLSPAKKVRLRNSRRRVHFGPGDGTASSDQSESENASAQLIRPCTPVAGGQPLVLTNGSLPEAALNPSPDGRTSNAGAAAASHRLADEPNLASQSASSLPAGTDETSLPGFMPGVFRVFLENGQTKSFRYDSTTVVSHIIDQLYEKICSTTPSTATATHRAATTAAQHLHSQRQHHPSCPHNPCSPMKVKATASGPGTAAGSSSIPLCCRPGRGHLALLMRELGSQSLSVSKMCVLEENLPIENLARRDNAETFHCDLRVALMPRDPFELFVRDRPIFDYLFTQCTNDVVNDRYSPELKLDTSLRLSALHIQQFVIQHNSVGRTSLKQIEKEHGYDQFVSKSLRESMKTKELRRMLAYYIKLNQATLVSLETAIGDDDPEATATGVMAFHSSNPQDGDVVGPISRFRKQLGQMELELKLHYIRTLQQLRSFGGRCFVATWLNRRTDVMLVVNALCGLSLVANIKTNTLQALAQFEEIEAIDVFTESEKTSRVSLFCSHNGQPLPTIRLSMLTEDVQHFVTLIEGYYRLFVEQAETVHEDIEVSSVLAQEMRSRGTPVAGPSTVVVSSPAAVTSVASGAAVDSLASTGDSRLSVGAQWRQIQQDFAQQAKSPTTNLVIPHHKSPSMEPNIEVAQAPALPHPPATTVPSTTASNWSPISTSSLPTWSPPTVSTFSAYHNGAVRVYIDETTSQSSPDASILSMRSGPQKTVANGNGEGALVESDDDEDDDIELSTSSDGAGAAVSATTKIGQIRERLEQLDVAQQQRLLSGTASQSVRSPNIPMDEGQPRVGQVLRRTSFKRASSCGSGMDTVSPPVSVAHSTSGSGLLGKLQLSSSNVSSASPAPSSVLLIDEASIPPPPIEFADTSKQVKESPPKQKVLKSIESVENFIALYRVPSPPTLPVDTLSNGLMSRSTPSEMPDMQLNSPTKPPRRVVVSDGPISSHATDRPADQTAAVINGACDLDADTASRGESKAASHTERPRSSVKMTRAPVAPPRKKNRGSLISVGTSSDSSLQPTEHQSHETPPSSADFCNGNITVPSSENHPTNSASIMVSSDTALKSSSSWLHINTAVENGPVSRSVSSNLTDLSIPQLPTEVSPAVKVGERSLSPNISNGRRSRSELVLSPPISVRMEFSPAGGLNASAGISPSSGDVSTFQRDHIEVLLERDYTTLAGFNNNFNQQSDNSSSGIDNDDQRENVVEIFQLVLDDINELGTFLLHLANGSPATAPCDVNAVPPDFALTRQRTLASVRRLVPLSKSFMSTITRRQVDVTLVELQQCVRALADACLNVEALLVYLMQSEFQQLLSACARLIDEFSGSVQLSVNVLHEPVLQKQTVHELFEQASQLAHALSRLIHLVRRLS